MTYEHIIYQVKDKLARITFNRPEKKNAIHWPMSEEISHALRAAEEDGDVSVIILKGAGSCFSAGYDLGGAIGQPRRQKGAVAAGAEDGGAEIGVWDSRARIQAHNEYLMEIFNNWKPVIAQVHGVCLGGAAGLALACDMLIASDDARLGYPPVRAIAPGEETAIFIWHVGPKKAKELNFTGDCLTGAEMVEHGMANYVFPLDELEAKTEKIARRIANVDVELLSLSKKMVNRVLDHMGFSLSLQAGSDFVTLANRLPSNKEFKRLVKEKGLRAALNWRDEPFGGGLGRYPPPAGEAGEDEE